MREDWNRRAREDAHYYVAFGRHGQDDAEFLDTAREIVEGLNREFPRFGTGVNWRAMRALEIGCGPGRLMRHLAARFGEVHGVDVSDEMIRLARQKLQDVPHAHVHTGTGSDLRAFADESFDFVYSYAVFQHIPSKEVVWSYLREARRVLKTGALLWFQVNGLAEAPLNWPVDTWGGVRFTPAEIFDFANHHDFQMYALEGPFTQYMWTCLRKRPDGWFAATRQAPPPAAARIRSISNPYSSEPAVPARGRFACASLWIEDLPAEVGINHVRVTFDGEPGTPVCLAPRRTGALDQLNVLLPHGVRTGLVPISLEWAGRPIAAPATARIGPPAPLVARLMSVADALDLCSGSRIVSRAVSLTFQELEDPAKVALTLDGRPVDEIAIHCADPRTPLHQLILKLPEWVMPGRHLLEASLGWRRFGPMELDVATGPGATIGTMRP